MDDTRFFQSQSQPAICSCVVIGVGNTLLADDSAGIAVVNRLRDGRLLPETVRIIDGGTIGLGLLHEIEEADALIIIDAAELGKPPGTVTILTDADMDEQMYGRKRSAHEVAVADLLIAATLMGRLAARRALVAIQPESTRLGLVRTAAVEAAIPKACTAVRSIIEEWTS